MPSRLDESARIGAEFQLAVLRLGVQTLAELLRLWRGMSTAEKIQTGGRWSVEAERLIREQRGRARQLGIAYYRITSALTTGSTVPDPDEPEPRNVTVGELRERFDRAAGIDPDRRPDIPGYQAPREPEPGPDPDTGIDLSEESPPDDTAVPVDEDRLDGPTPDSSPEPPKLADEVQVVTDILGGRNLQKRNDGIDTTRPAVEVDQERRENDDNAGVRTAAGGERIAMDGARDVVHDLTERDPQAIAWVRVSTTGTPCGFCAMLMSRGPVYKSQASGGSKTANAPTVRKGTGRVGDPYHDNCRCVAVPVFAASQYDNDPRFDLNRRYEALWPTVTRGLAGKAALSSWRRFIREEQRRIPDTPAQVA